MGCVFGQHKDAVAENNPSLKPAEQVVQPAPAMSTSEEDEDPRFGEVLQAVNCGWPIFMLADYPMMIIFDTRYIGR